MKASLRNATFVNKDLGIFVSILKLVKDKKSIPSDWYQVSEVICPFLFSCALLSYQMEFYFSNGTLFSSLLNSVPDTRQCWSVYLRPSNAGSNQSRSRLYPFYDIFISCMSSLYYYVIFAKNGSVRGFIIHFCLYTTSIVFPAIMSKLVHAVAIMPSLTGHHELLLNVDLNEECRLFTATLLSLRNSFVVAIFGLPTVIYANILICLILHLDAIRMAQGSTRDVSWITVGSTATIRPFYQHLPFSFLLVIIHESFNSDPEFSFKLVSSLDGIFRIFFAVLFVFVLNMVSSLSMESSFGTGEKMVVSFLSSQRFSESMYVSATWLMSMLLLLYV